MIGKTGTGTGFGGCLRYVMEEDKKPEILQSHGVYGDNPNQIARQFQAIRQENLKVIKAVWHTSLSFAYIDKVSDEKKVEIALDYLEKMCFNNHQYIIVKHNDRKHEHIHIIANRVGFDGQAVDQAWCQNRTAKACDELELKHNLTIARDQGHKKINDKIPAKKQAKEYINKEVTIALKGSKDLNQFKEKLQEKGIDVQLHQHSETGKNYGVSFGYEGMKFKGSAVDHKYKEIAEELNLEQERKVQREIQERIDRNLLRM